MGLVTQWRRSGLAIALVLAGAVACSDRFEPNNHEQTGAGAGGNAGDNASSSAGGESGQGTGGNSGESGGNAAGAAGVSGGNAGTVGGGEPEHDGGMLPEPRDAAVLDGGAPDAEPPEPLDESCLQGLSNFSAPGPFTFTATEWQREDDVARIKAWIPEVPDGCQVPMVHFANGTGASCAQYRSTLEQLASFGFVALCFENTNTGDGTQCIEAVEMAFSMLPALVSSKVGFAGHHAGGQGAFMCLYRAEEEWHRQAVLAGYALTPAHGHGGSTPPSWTEAYGSIDAPALMISTEGGLVSEMWVGEAFDHMSPATELYQYKAVGAMDLPIAFEPMNASILPWFRWKLLGDREACEYIKALPDSETWNLVKAVNAAECDEGGALARSRSE